MCRRLRDITASQPTPRPVTRSSKSRPSRRHKKPGGRLHNPTTSLIANLRVFLSEQPILLSLSEIAAATNNFFEERISTSSLRCTLRGRDTIVFQRPFRGSPADLRSRLAVISKSHHRSVVSLFGASLSPDHIYLVYEFVQGASLANCLRNPRNTNFTPLSSWISRIQVAADLAQGLEYIHHYSGGRGILHNRIKSSAIIITEPELNAVICHFGAAFLAGDVSDDISEAAPASFSKMSNSHSNLRKFEGTRGYLAPELIAGAGVSLRSDVFALGVVLLELISGEGLIKKKFDQDRNEYRSFSLIETAKEMVGTAELEKISSETATELDLAEGRMRRIRHWVDGRLKDSYPIEVAEKMVGIALLCVEVEAEKRPNMAWVEGNVSKLFLESKAWAERIRVPAGISVSFAPR